MSHNPRILVEDDPDLLDMVNRYLRQWKFDANPFNDPLEALAHFKENPDSYSRNNRLQDAPDERH
jgi:DNA-binding response OmpR family regulator